MTQTHAVQSAVGENPWRLTVRMPRGLKVQVDVARAYLQLRMQDFVREAIEEKLTRLEEEGIIHTPPPR